MRLPALLAEEILSAFFRGSLQHAAQSIIGTTDPNAPAESAETIEQTRARDYGAVVKTTIAGWKANCSVHVALRVLSRTAYFAALAGCAPAPHASAEIDAAGAPHARSSESVQAGAVRAAQVLDVGALSPISAIIPRLAAKRAIFVGETHDRFGDHLSQLEIIRLLHAARPGLAVGLESFQQPFQEHLDRYVAGEIGERELVRRTEYYERWRYDYRLYRPVMRFARENGIPLVALNSATEVVGAVSEHGFDALPQGYRDQVPHEIDRSDVFYRERLRTIYEQHPGAGERDFSRFVDVQLLWDETMAERAAQYLLEHSQRYMVILAGSGHVAFRSGIPNRLVRRVDAEIAVVVNGIDHGIDPSVADFLILGNEQELPPAGRLGVLLDDSDSGVKIELFAERSAARDAGIREGDQITALNGTAVERIADVKIGLWDKRPGDTVSVTVMREGWLAPAKELLFDIELQ